MTWNYRIIEHDTWFGLHEVHYDETGKPVSHTENPVVATDKENGVEDLIASLERMVRDTKRPILQVTSIGREL